MPGIHPRPYTFVGGRGLLRNYVKVRCTVYQINHKRHEYKLRYEKGNKGNHLSFIDRFPRCNMKLFCAYNKQKNSNHSNRECCQYTSVDLPVSDILF